MLADYQKTVRVLSSVKIKLNPTPGQTNGQRQGADPSQKYLSLYKALGNILWIRHYIVLSTIPVKENEKS
jgi:hypothetical protein